MSDTEETGLPPEVQLPPDLVSALERIQFVSRLRGALDALDVDPEREAAAERAAAERTERWMSLLGAIRELVPGVLDRVFKEKPSIAFAERVPCATCADWLHDLGGPHLDALLTHLQEGHDHWPAALEDGVLEVRRAVRNLQRQLALVDMPAAPAPDVEGGDTTPAPPVEPPVTAARPRRARAGRATGRRRAAPRRSRR